MIYGIGTDLCDARRIERSLSKFGQRFKDRIFTTGEQSYCDAKSGAHHYYAKRFAAKEALAKALSGPHTGSLSWTDVEVVNDPSGRPRLVLHGGAKRRLQIFTPEHHEAFIHLSLSDEPPYASAYVIVELRPIGSLYNG